MPGDKVTIRKYNGDDIYSWAVFVGDRIAHPTLTGLARRQAQYYRDKIRQQRTGAAPLKVVPDAD